MSFATIRSKIRNLLNENAKSGSDIFTYGSSRIFSISEENIVNITEVYINDVALGESGAGWSYSSVSNKVTIAAGVSLTAGDTIQIDYSYYANYSNDELDGYSKSSLSYLAVYQYKTFEVDSDDINPEPTEAEENLIALIARIVIRPDNQEIRLPDMSILPPRTASITTEQMIQTAIASFKKDTHGLFEMINTNKFV